MKFDSTVEVKPIAIHHLLGGRVDAQRLVFLDNLFQLLFLFAAIHTQALIHHCHTLREVAEEHIIAKAIVEVDTVVAVVNIAKLAHHIEIAFKHASHIFLKRHQLMAHGADWNQVVFHCQIHIAGASKSAFPLLELAILVGVAAFLVLFLKSAHHHIMMLFGETATLTKITDGQTATQCLACLFTTALFLKGGIVFFHIAIQDVRKFADARQQHHFPHNGGKPLALHRNVEFAVCVLADAHLGRIEAIATQQRKEPQRQIIHFALHKVNFLVGDLHIWHIIHLLLEQVGKPFGILGVVAVEESVFHFGARICMKNIIQATKSICIVVCEMRDNLFHYVLIVDCYTVGSDMPQSCR